MTSSIDRFRKRQRLKGTHTVYEVNDEIIALSEEFLASETDTEAVEELFQKTATFYDVSVSPQEIDEFLDKFEKDFNQEKFHRLIEDCKKDVVHSIVTPFGLGKIVAAYDKTGGNVTTVHNANQNIYAKEADKYNRTDYANTKNSEGQQFAGSGKNSVGSNYTKSQMDSKGNVVDAYTGKSQKANTASPDHIESLSQYHKDAGFMQSKTQKADFATDENNLALTDRSINQSMRDYDKQSWQEKTKDGQTNTERFDIDKDKLNQQVEQGKATAKEHAPTNLEKAGYYGKNTVTTGFSEGGKVALQQALGLVISEFFTATFDEIIDIYKNGFYSEFDEKFLSVLKQRLARIGERLSAKWKDVAVAFKDGFISGFISNLVTTVINLFVTTAKRVVRIIREGLFSLFRAVKLLLFPPEGMTLEERMHEVKKLIATGLIVSVGVILEEYVEKFIASSGVLAPYANVLSTIFVGAVTGLSITMVVYYLDKKKNDKEMLSHLLSSTKEKYQNIESMLSFS